MEAKRRGACAAGNKSLCLLLGYQQGFQVWNLRDTDDIHELFSIREDLGPVYWIDAVPTPVPKVTSLTDPLEQYRPLVAYITDVGDNCKPRGRQNSVQFFSLRTRNLVRTLDLGGDSARNVRCNGRIAVVLLQSNTLKIYSTMTLLLVATLSDVYSFPANDAPAFDIGSRFVVYASSTALGPKRRKGESHTVDASDRSEGDSEGDPDEVGLNARKVAGKVAKDLVVGAKVIGGYGYQALTSYFAPHTSGAGNGGDGKAHDGEREALQHGSARQGHSGEHTRPDRKSETPEGVVIIRDIDPKALSSPTPVTSLPIVTHWKPHTNPVSLTAFNSNQTLLLTASTQATTFYLWQVPGRPLRNSPRSPKCLYKLERGFTSASIENVAWSFDSRWVGVTTSRGTTHVYRIDPTGQRKGATSAERLNVINGIAEPRGKGTAGAVYSPAVESDGSRGIGSLYPIARVKQQLSVEKDGHESGGDRGSAMKPPMLPLPATGGGQDGSGKGMASVSRAALCAVFLPSKPTSTDRHQSISIRSNRPMAGDKSSPRASPSGTSPGSAIINHPEPTNTVRLHRQRLLTLHPTGTLTLHHLDINEEDHARPNLSPQSPKNNSTSPLDRLSPTGLIGHALKMGLGTGREGRHVQVRTTEVTEWHLSRETDWSEIGPSVMSSSAATQPKIKSHHADAPWASKIEISTYNAAALGQPIWMGPQFVFQMFAESAPEVPPPDSSATGPGRKIVAGAWESSLPPTPNPIKSATAFADLSDLPPAIPISIKREAVKPYGDENVPANRIYPAVDRRNDDVELGISTAMDSTLDIGSSAPMVPIRDATRKVSSDPEDLSFDDAFHISIIEGVRPPPALPPLHRSSSSTGAGRSRSSSSSAASTGHRNHNSHSGTAGWRADVAPEDLFETVFGVEGQNHIDQDEGRGDEHVDGSGDGRADRQAQASGVGHGGGYDGPDDNDDGADVVEGDDDDGTMDSVLLGMDGEVE
ncbi:Breast carcinoma amplified sequence 3 [Borealophlyctis nickersoniae]|nr:Breast carcinoma amplified sequence 3 [Borealophlyctis nickersoniae]